ncbi:hypothetical protein [Vibrio sp. TRT 1302]|uniref:hypothetical protein n=1 Tax=Vibrio sp. TRT 1302 TaxID=3418504 RepID=UPI003CF1835E
MSFYQLFALFFHKSLNTLVNGQSKHAGYPFLPVHEIFYQNHIFTVNSPISHIRMNHLLQVSTSPISSDFWLASIMQKINIYQVFTRLFGNTKQANIPQQRNQDFRELITRTHNAGMKAIRATY